MLNLTIKEGGISFAVKVQPRASRSAVAGEIDGALKVRVAAPPVDGEANSELIRLLSKLFEVPKQNVEIVSGQTSRNKVVRISGVNIEKFQEVVSEKVLSAES